eukprot:GHVS01039667.1.p1 GENE.GHVS01039667.1~~GHVS01039667.1.p1  ORF type:complete len:357 (+),score=36.91 GHVS01039667.1:138-1208(+)
MNDSNRSQAPEKSEALSEGGAGASDANECELAIDDNLNILATDEDLALAQAAWTTILKLCRSGQEPIVDRVLSDEFLGPIERHAIETPNEEIKLRLLHSFVALAVTSERAFKRCEERIFKHLLELYFSDDLLVKLNVMEILQEIGGSSSFGISYLIKEGLPHQFVKDISEQGLLDADARIGILDLLASVLQAAPALATELTVACDGALPACIEQFLACPTSCPDSAAMHLSGINTWGRICSCQEGIQAFLKYGNLRSHMDEAVKSTNTSFSCAAMRAWTSIAAAIPPDKLPKEIVSVLEGSVVPRVLEVIARRPFAESRETCYAFMTAMMGFDSAARALVQNEVRTLNAIISLSLS